MLNVTLYAKIYRRDEEGSSVATKPFGIMDPYIASRKRLALRVGHEVLVLNSSTVCHIE